MSDMIDSRFGAITSRLYSEMCEKQHLHTSDWFDAVALLLDYIEELKHDPKLPLPKELNDWRVIKCSVATIRDVAAREFAHTLGKLEIKAGIVHTDEEHLFAEVAT
jgi:hypothetical protein